MGKEASQLLHTRRTHAWMASRGQKIDCKTIRHGLPPTADASVQVTVRRAPSNAITYADIMVIINIELRHLSPPALRDKFHETPITAPSPDSNPDKLVGLATSILLSHAFPLQLCLLAFAHTAEATAVIPAASDVTNECQFLG